MERALSAADSYDAMPESVVRRGDAVGVDPFSPADELEALKRLPRGERKEATRVFKEKLLAQEEAWAACRVALEQVLEKNPDASRQELSAVISEFSREHGFTEEQEEMAEAHIDEYRAMRSLVLETRQRFPNDLDLVHELTGLAFDSSTPFAITVGPLSIDIVTDAATAQKIYDRNLDSDKLARYSAFASESLSGVNYSVYVDTSHGTSKETFIHELEHQKNKIFRQFFDRRMNEWHRNRLLEAYLQTRDEDLRRVYAESFHQYDLEWALDRAKDEILAVASEGERSVSKFQVWFRDRDAEDNSYDYLRNARKSHGDKGRLWELVTKRMLIDEYDEKVDRGVRAYEALERFYSRKEIAGILADKSIEEWPKFSARVYQEKLAIPDVTAQDVRALEERRKAQAEEELRKKEVRERLTRRSFLLAGSVAVVGLAAKGVSDIPETQRRIHANLENVSELRTGNADYRIAYSEGLYPEQPELINGADGLILEMPLFDEPVQWTELALHDSGPRSADSGGLSMVARMSGLDSQALPPRYQDIIRTAKEREVPLYFLDLKTADIYESVQATMAKEGATVASATIGAYLVKMGIEGTARPTRRSMLKGIGTALLGLPLLAPYASRMAKAVPLEPSVDSLSHKAVSDIEQLSQTLAPGLEATSQRLRMVLMAQKSETLGKWLSEKLGRTPSLSMILDRQYAGIETYLKKTEEERVRILKNGLKEAFAQSGTIVRVSSKDPGSPFTQRRFQDETFDKR